MNDNTLVTVSRRGKHVRTAPWIDLVDRFLDLTKDVTPIIVARHQLVDTGRATLRVSKHTDPFTLELAQ